jgi:phospholipase/lecithinase/hemolysin
MAHIDITGTQHYVGGIGHLHTDVDPSSPVYATTSATNNSNTRVPQLQQLLKANACGADAIVDVSVYPEVLAASNTAYYPDGLHPTAAIHNLIAGAVGETVNRLLLS